MRSTLQRLSKLGKRGKEHRMADGQRSIRQRQAQVRFPGARRSEKDNIGAGSHKREVGQLAQPALGERGLEREIEPVQGLFGRNTRTLESAGHRLLFAAIQLRSQSALQEGLIGPLLGPRAFENLWQLCFQIGQIQVVINSFLHASASCNSSRPQYKSYSESARLATSGAGFWCPRGAGERRVSETEATAAHCSGWVTLSWDRGRFSSEST